MPFLGALGGIASQIGGQTSHQGLANSQGQGLQGQGQMNASQWQQTQMRQAQAMMNSGIAQQYYGAFGNTVSGKLQVLQQLMKDGLIKGNELEIRAELFGIDSLNDDEKARLEIKKMLKFK